MDKFKYLFKNMGFLFVGTFASKIMIFLLVPLYTSVLTTEEYGGYDLLYTTIQLLAPILSLNVVDGVTRFTIGVDRAEQCKVFSVGVKYVLTSFVVLTLGTIAAVVFFDIPVLDSYWLEFVLLYLAYLLDQLMIQFARGIDDVLGVSIAGIVGTGFMIVLNIYFLLVAKLGLEGYFYANILSLLTPALFLFIRNKSHRYLIGRCLLWRPNALEKSIFAYCAPLIFTTLSWTINNLADRYVVTLFCGIDVNGVYSVAYKIPAILNAFQGVFIQAWQLSAIRELNSEEGAAFFNKTYQGCHTIMILLCSALICGTRIVASLMFAKDFYEAWVFVPTLLLYIVFNTLSGTVGGIFSAVKDSGAFAKSAIVSALVNIVLNFVMVYVWGAMGAAIATVISSIVIWAMRYYYSRKYMTWTVDLKKHFLQFALLGAQAALMTCITHPLGYVAQVAILALLVLWNIRPLKTFLEH